MRNELTLAAIGAGAGLIAAFAMNRYQGATLPLFGMDKGNDDPSTVKAADTLSKTVEGRPVTQKHRELAGSAVHYAVGAALGAGYALAVARAPATSAGFGTAYGAATMLVLDDVLVPTMGWGPWPAPASPSTAYSLTSHLVFGIVLEGVRRAGTALVDRQSAER